MRARAGTPRELALRLPDWFWRPEFLALLMLGAVLRMVFPGDASFLSDQAQMLAIGRSALAHGALPATGILSSIGTLNPPASIYLLLPFALMGNPIWATLATGLANVVALVALYAIANRHVGRWGAFATGSLYATAAWAIYFSRFIWQPNLLAPVVVLFFWTACRGAIEGKRGWLGWNVLLWGIAAQLHPTAVPLILLTVVAGILGWRTLRWRDLGWSALALAVLFLPTLLWELASGWSDVPLYLAYARTPGRVNDQVIKVLAGMLEPQSQQLFGPSSFYAQFYHRIEWLVPITHALFGFGELWLALALAWQGWRALARWRGWPAPLELGLPGWRFLLLLVLWQAAPLALMIKHSTAIYQHYLQEILPAPYLVIGAALGWLAIEVVPAVARALRISAWPVRQLAVAVLLLFITAVSVAQTGGVAKEIETIRHGQYNGTVKNAYTHYGIPLGDQQSLVNTTLAEARKYDARPMLATSWLHEQSLGYLAALGSSSAITYDAEQCLLVPSAGTQGAVVLMLPGMTSSGLVEHMTGVSPLARINTRGSRPLDLYRMRPGAHMPGEQTLAAAGTTKLQIAGYSLTGKATGTRRLFLRWQGAPDQKTTPATRLLYWYGAPASGNPPPVANYIFTVQALDSAGHALSTTQVTCRWLAWPTGMNLYTWVNVPPTHGNAIAEFHVTIARQLYEAPVTSFGPIPLETGYVTLGSSQPVASETIRIHG